MCPRKPSLFIIFFIFAACLIAQENPWPFLDTRTIGANHFVKAHPTYDGRGVVIIVCDTGVDMGVDGLQKTSIGETKVIDARDFSGQGDVFLEEAVQDTVDGENALKVGTHHLTGFESLTYQPNDSVYWIGIIDEYEMFRNSKVRDINHNGTENDIFLLLTFPVEIEDDVQWVIYVDEDSDGNIQDETPLFDYEYKQNTFTLKGREPKFENTYMTFAIKILEDDLMASIHVSDGSHGTHCAGIASGYHIFGNENNNGIAPGAKIISAKIGDNRLSGGNTTTGSMKKAYDFGVQWAKDHDVPVVFSMSYGIGSEIEGRSDIENYLNELMEENENIVIVTSNGNEGPGISSAGNPATARNILSVGAMLPYETARDVYGYANEKDVIFHFSSRGGETFKPDVLAPGAAVSTVPGYATSERMWGTSMACPQVAGAAALLISACLQEDIPVKGRLINRAIKESAQPMPNYTKLDQGHGVVNVERAFEIIKRLTKRNPKEWPVDYEIETVSPVYPDFIGPASYWRTGGYVPESKTEITIRPVLDKDLLADEKHDFFKAYQFKSDEPWIVLDKKNSYLKADHPMKVGVRYQKSLLTKPGLYVGMITGYAKEGFGKEIPEFECLQTIIKPYEFYSGNDYKMMVKNHPLASGQYDRFFVLVPPGASAMQIELKPSANKWSGTYAYVFDPDGKLIKKMSKISDSSQEPVTLTVLNDALIPGIWEIVPYAYHNLEKTSYYDLSVHFEGIKISPNPITDYTFPNGENPKGQFQVMNYFNEFEGSAQGLLAGYTQSQVLHVESDSYYYPFKIADHVSHVRFKLSVSKETWNLFTDVAVNVLDQDDLVVKRTSMNYRDLELDFWPALSGEYALEVVAGFAYPGKQYDLWDLNLTEIYFNTQPIKIFVSQKGGNKVTLYPQLESTLEFELSGIPQIVPDGYYHIGEINFKDRVGEIAGTVEIKLGN